MISNCFFAAIIAKIKDPKNVKIIRISKKLNYGRKHYFWYDAKDGMVYHFVDVSKKEKRRFLYNGRLKEISKLAFDQWISLKINIATSEYKSRLTSKYGVGDFNIELGWHSPYLEDIYPDKNHWCTKNNPYVFVSSKDGIKLQSIDIPINENEMWCYASPLCPIPYDKKTEDTSEVLGIIH